MKRLVRIGCLLLAACLARADAQTVGPPRPLDNISPGTTTKGFRVTCDANVNACLLEYNGDDNGATLMDLFPIPSGGRLTLKLLDAREVTCCLVTNADNARTTMIGSQASSTTAHDWQGLTTDGPCFDLDGEGDSWTEVVSYPALIDSGLAPAGLCNPASSNNQSAYYSVHGVCANDADCASIGGHSAQATCVGNDAGEKRDSALSGPNHVAGVYYACRASTAGTARIGYWLTR